MRRQTSKSATLVKPNLITTACYYTGTSFINNRFTFDGMSHVVGDCF